MFPYLIQGKNIVVVIGNNSHTIGATHINYEKIKEAIKANDEAAVKDLIEPKKTVLNYGAGNISVQGDKMFWKDKEFDNSLADRVIEMYLEGFPIDPMVAFMENLMENPSNRAVVELYEFLEKGDLPITQDGHFLAYKKVRDDYKDVYSGTFDNSVGQIVEMVRNEVDDDKDNTCSYGLHFCSKGYLNCFGGERIMILKINPRDVVSIPADYEATKGRCCRYEVIGELGVNVEPATAFTQAVQDNANSEVMHHPV